MVKPAVFLLIKTNGDCRKLSESLKNDKRVVWNSSVYGEYQITAYAQFESDEEMADFVEAVRIREEVAELDDRMVKIIPKDDQLGAFEFSKKEKAVLLIGVDYSIEKERVVTWNLREIKGVKLARAMWGTSDIIAIVEADDHESMRNLICDEIKASKGVKSNSTLYCYPAHTNEPARNA